MESYIAMDYEEITRITREYAESYYKRPEFKACNQWWIDNRIEHDSKCYSDFLSYLLRDHCVVSNRRITDLYLLTDAGFTEGGEIKPNQDYLRGIIAMLKTLFGGEILKYNINENSTDNRTECRVD